MKDWMKKNFGWVIALILLLLLVIFLAYKFHKSEIEKALLSCKNEQLATDLNDQKSTTDLYIAKLDTCENGIARPIPAPVIVEQVQAAVNAPRKVSKKPSKKNDVAELAFPKATFSAPVRSAAPVRTETSYSAEDSSLPITNYEGAITGNFGTTINSDGHLIYFVKESVIANNKGNIAPRLNGVNGEPFVLDKNSGYWYYVDSRLISSQEINSSGYAVVWNVYIGKVNYGTGSYPAFLPHQSLKALINKVRGFEYGEITKEDLAQMGQENASIANGTIRPLRITSSPGHDNANFWHGWNFVTKIYAKKKTVTQ